MSQQKQKKYLWMDGSVHFTPDSNWNQKEAERRGLIPLSSPLVKIKKIVILRKKTPIQEIAERDKFLTDITRSNGNVT